MEDLDHIAICNEYWRLDRELNKKKKINPNKEYVIKLNKVTLKFKVIEEE